MTAPAFTSASRAAPLRIGIACFSTFGGSGVIASEIGMLMAAAGHQVHVFSDDRPGRLGDGLPNLTFHRVDARQYPQIKGSDYLLALASKLVDVCRHERLQLVHAHYALPHAVAASLARQVLGAPAAPRLVTTLHGTDITLVGSDPSFLPLTRFSIMASDAVTVPSAWLRHETYRVLDVPPSLEIDVIPNFVDGQRFSPAPSPSPTSTSPRSAPVLIHVSNFRPVKRVADVVRVFAGIRARQAATLVLVGDGPDRAAVQALAHELGVSADVRFLGETTDLTQALRASDLFLLPSATESFGLAALEAMACGVPVVAYAVGGLGEVIRDGETGLLTPLGDVGAMTAAVRRLLDDPALRARMAAAARQDAAAQFQVAPAVERYVNVYRRVLGA